MKIYYIIATIVYLLMGYTANFFLFKFSTLPFIGFLLLGIVVIAIVATIVGKANKKRKGVQGEPDAFIFPDKTAKKMKKIDLGTQYEASVLSSALLMLGIVLFLIYFVFFTSSSWMMKGLIIFNSICGLGLMGGMLVTYYQQLVSYRESTKFLHQYAKSPANKTNSRQVGGRASIPTDYGARPADASQEELYMDEPYEEYEEPEQQPYDYTNERRNMRYG